MAVVTTVSNHAKYMQATKKVDFSADVFKAILMGSEFVFDKDAHATLADVTKTAWIASTAYSLDDITEPITKNGHSYKCTTAGTSAASEPTWNTGDGTTTTDGTTVWTEEKTDVQLPTGNGYTQDTKTLTGVTVTEDDTNDKAAVTWSGPTWTASGGDIGPTGAIIIYDDTTTDDTIVFCGDFGTDYTITDGSSFQPQNLAVDIL